MALPHELQDTVLAAALGGTLKLPVGETITPRKLAASLALAPDETIAPESVAGSMHTLPQLLLAERPASHRGEGEPSHDLEARGLLGEGGMGRVLLAHQRSLERDVAVKVVAEHVRDPLLLESLVVEGRLTGMLEHPNIVPVHALGRDEHGRPLLVMKRIEGVPWSRLLADPAHPAWERIGADGDRLRAHLAIFVDVCNAVHYAHSRGVVHRDIKPDNVMVGYFGEVYVVDWGVAMRTDPAGRARAARLVGTPVYMAPEMLRGEIDRIDARTDVYLLGATLHHVLTGRPRHDAADLHQVFSSVIASRPFAFDDAVPDELADICNQATHALTDQRFASALALRKAIDVYLTHSASIALCHRLEERLDALPPDGDLDAREQTLLECRFGFEQALRDFADNARARACLDRCLRMQIDLELSRNNAPGARVALAALSSRDPSLEALVEGAERSLATRLDRARRLDELERENDPSIGSRSRAVVVVAAVALGSIVVAFLPYRQGIVIDRTGSLVIALLLFSLFSGLGLALRKHLFASAFNRKLFGVMLLALATIVGHRALSFHTQEPVPRVLAHDMLLLFAVGGGVTITHSARLWPAALTFGVAHLGLIFYPDYAAPIFSVSALAALPWFVLISPPRKRGDKAGA